MGSEDSGQGICGTQQDGGDTWAGRLVLSPCSLGCGSTEGCSAAALWWVLGNSSGHPSLQLKRQRQPRRQAFSQGSVQECPDRATQSPIVLFSLFNEHLLSCIKSFLVEITTAGSVSCPQIWRWRSDSCCVATGCD